MARTKRRGLMDLIATALLLVIGPVLLIKAVSSGTPTEIVVAILLTAIGVWGLFA